MSLEGYSHLIDLTPYPRPALLNEKEKDEACGTLLKFLCRERGLIAAFSSTFEKKRALVRCYMNERGPNPVPPELLSLQDALFWTESVERGIVKIAELPEMKYNISHWHGNIIRLDADAIVNAANRSLLGCFLPGHNCIDNVIHSAAGMQMRRDCQRIISAQGHEEETGGAKVTRGYNLPAKYVIHTVGPMVGRGIDNTQRADLRASYLACLDLAEELKLSSIAFCCISTGVFNFPGDEAAEIATGAVVNWKLRHKDSKLKVIFDTFLERDKELYDTILQHI